MLVSGRWYGEKAMVPTCACMVGGWFWYFTIIRGQEVRGRCFSVW